MTPRGFPRAEILYIVYIKEGGSRGFLILYFMVFTLLGREACASYSTTSMGGWHVPYQTHAGISLRGERRGSSPGGRPPSAPHSLIPAVRRPTSVRGAKKTVKIGIRKSTKTGIRKSTKTGIRKLENRRKLEFARPCVAGEVFDA